MAPMRAFKWNFTSDAPLGLGVFAFICSPCRESETQRRKPPSRKKHIFGLISFDWVRLAPPPRPPGNGYTAPAADQEDFCLFGGGASANEGRPIRPKKTCETF